MATFYIGNKQIMGGGVGEVNTAKTATTANNSLALNGVPQNRILEKWATGIGTVESPGWYRIGSTKGWNSRTARTGILIIEKDYTNTEAESYMFALSVGWNGAYDIVQLSGLSSTRYSFHKNITKIRLLGKEDDVWYIDVYYNGSVENHIGAIGIGGIVIAGSIVPSTVPEGYTIKSEFDVVNGFKAMTEN